MNLDKLKQEIEQQTRNGRKEIYLKVSDLKELGYNIDTTEDRIFVSEDDILRLILKAKRKSFKENLVTSSKDIDDTKVDYSFELKDFER